MAMLKKLTLILLLISFTFFANAQRQRGRIKLKTSEAGLVGNLGYYGNPHWGIGANIHYALGVGRGKQHFNFGAGLRANTFFTKKRFYSTSSPELVSLNPGGADSLYFAKVQTNTLNAYFLFMFHIKPGVDICFTTDIGGINFGDGRKANFLSYETNPVITGVNDEYKTEPYAFNLNMYEKNNSYGTIYSEVYGNFALSNAMRWRLGLSYMRNEYVVNQDIPLNGRRFSQRHWMVTSGIAWNLRKNKTDGLVF